MTSTRPRVDLSPGLVVLSGLLAAFLAGVAIAQSVALGISLTIALLYLPLVLLNLPLGIALWLPLVSIEQLQVVGIGPTAATLLLGVVWLGTVQSRGSETRELLRYHRPRIAQAALLLIWLTLSLAWAQNASLVDDVLWQWLVGVGAFVLLVTTLSKPEHIRMVCLAFVIGTTLSVFIGLAMEDFSSAETAAKAAVDQGTRVEGGAGDPNFLAAGIVPALLLLAGVAAGVRSIFGRFGLMLMALMLAVGFAAAESRGGLMALGVATVAALIFLRGKRVYVVIFVAFFAAGAAGWFALYPQAFERITHFNTEGSGRSEFWEVAYRIWQDHPLIGAGLNNYLAASPDYVREPGALKFVSLIADKPHVAHNTYLQLLAETGVIGLALFLIFVFTCLRTAWLAANRFEARGDFHFALLSRAVLVAGIAMTSASIFISNGGDKRLWILLSLGPAMLAASARTARTEASAGSASFSPPGPPSRTGRRPEPRLSGA